MIAPFITFVNIFTFSKLLWVQQQRLCLVSYDSILT
jgi:hypothetical protein